MKTSQALFLIIGSAIAVPAPQFFPPAYCQTKYTIDSQVNDIDGALIVGDYTVAGGSELTDGSSFETSITIEAGLELSISDIVGAGVSASVSTTTTKSTSQSATVPCPDGPWKCALAIYPQMLRVKGEKVAANEYCKDEEKDGKLPEDYSVLFPVEGDSGGVRSRVEVCACRNYEHWADDGAPSIVCDDCA